MAARKIDAITIGNTTARIYRDAALDEFIVKFDQNGAHMREADYHTGTRSDAYATAVEALRRAAGLPHVPEVHVGRRLHYTTVSYQEGAVLMVFSTKTGKPSELRDIAELYLNDARQVPEQAPMFLERARCASLAAAVLESKA